MCVYKVTKLGRDLPECRVGQSIVDIGKMKKKIDRGFTVRYWYSEVNVRVMSSMSDKEFEDGSRVEEVGRSANSVRLPVRGHRSDFGFRASALSPPSKTAVVL